jgi:hypothetical protein
VAKYENTVAAILNRSARRLRVTAHGRWVSQMALEKKAGTRDCSTHKKDHIMHRVRTVPKLSANGSEAGAVSHRNSVAAYESTREDRGGERYEMF